MMSAGFLLPSPDSAVIWRGPKVCISKILNSLNFAIKGELSVKFKDMFIFFRKMV